MNPIDLARIAAERELTADERQQLARACADDPELAEFVAAYRDVHALTGLASAARSRATRSRRRALVAMAAAVALVALTGAVAFAMRAPRGTEVAVSAIPMREPAPIVRTQPPLMTEATADLASWTPDAPGSTHWLTSLEDAQAIAAATHRPVLLFVYHPTCPWCAARNKVTWPDARVSELTARCIPVKVNVMETSEEFQRQMTAWPFVTVRDASGRTLRDVSGYRQADDMSQELRAALNEADLETALPWEDARRFAAALASGREAEEQGRLGVALESYRSLLSAPGAFAEEARDGLRRLDVRARRALLLAERDAQSNPSVALGDLQAAAEQFRGTPHASDLERVRAALQKTGRFPRLDFAQPQA